MLSGTTASTLNMQFFIIHEAGRIVRYLCSTLSPNEKLKSSIVHTHDPLWCMKKFLKSKKYHLDFVFTITCIKHSRTFLERPPHWPQNVVCKDRWSLVTGSVILKCRPFCQKYVVCQDRWSLRAVVSQERFHCTSRSDFSNHKRP